MSATSSVRCRLVRCGKEGVVRSWAFGCQVAHLFLGAQGQMPCLDCNGPLSNRIRHAQHTHSSKTKKRLARVVGVWVCNPCGVRALASLPRLGVAADTDTRVVPVAYPRCGRNLHYTWCCLAVMIHLSVWSENGLVCVESRKYNSSPSPERSLK